jgi:hypothetical protein
VEKGGLRKSNKGSEWKWYLLAVLFGANC